MNRTKIHTINPLVIGAGGREHALCRAIAKSPLCNKLYAMPGNAGTHQIAENINADICDNKKIIRICKEKNIDVVIIGPEIPLENGLADACIKNNIRVFGPTKKAAKLETSKIFTRNLCKKYNIPSPQYQTFTTPEKAKNFIKKNQKYPLVIKADGLAAGKGVIIAQNKNHAENAVNEILRGKFGNAGKKIIIEEYLQGPEVSLFTIVNGENITHLTEARDYKRALDGDKGENTGGMGAFSPVNDFNDKLRQKTLNTIIKPTAKAMCDNGTPYHGILYAGLIITQNGPKLIEYNVRFGDPECQAIIMRLKTDFLEIILKSCQEKLKNTDIKWHKEYALTLIMAAKGYPKQYQKGDLIPNLKNTQHHPNVEIFHAGTQIKNGNIITSGGRVLAVTARAKTLENARKYAYQTAEKIKWKNAIYRKDIGENSNPKPNKKKQTKKQKDINIGIAFGGGGARGLAHIAVIEAFEEMGLKPNIISGVSLGALIGASYAAGMSAYEIANHFQDALGTKRKAAKRLLTGKQTRITKLIDIWNMGAAWIDGNELLQLIKPEQIPNHFEALQIPLKIITTDFYGHCEYVIKTGKLEPAIAATMALPGVIAPQEINGKLLLEGALSNPIPYDHLQEAQIKIACDIAGKPQAKQQKIPKGTDFWFRASAIMQYALLKEKLKNHQPDIFISLPVGHFRLLEFFKAKDIIQAAREKKDQIKKNIENAINDAQ